jgi:Uma2 family endonuclease
LLHEFVLAQASGEVFFAPLRVRLFPRTMREPDIVYLRPSRLTGNRRRVSDGADLAMEVVSDGEENRLRDLVTKRDEYARAGIEEYWIVDPQEKRVTVLTLDSGSYRVHGEFTPGMKAMSAMFPEFTVDVAAAFAAGEGAAKA